MEGTTVTRVLMISSVPFDLSGLPLFILRLAGAMDPQRVQVDLLCGGTPSEEAVRLARQPILSAPNRLRHPAAYIRRVSKLIRENQYDVVHAHGNSCTLTIELLAAKLGGARVRIAHSHNSHCRYRLLHHILRPPFDHLYTHAFACGQDAGKWLFQNRSFAIIPNAIDTGRFAFSAQARREVREELGLSDSARVIGCAAHFNAQKNHSFLLDAFAQAAKDDPDLTLILAGDGPLKEPTQQKARELGLEARIRFLGLRGDMPRLLSGMDIMALPSLFEGFPTVALEWQCAGLPILLSDRITRDCALTQAVQFLPLNENDWAEAMKTPPSHDREASSRAGRLAVSKAGYDLKQTAEKVMRAYQTFTKSAARSSKERTS